MIRLMLIALLAILGSCAVPGGRESATLEGPLLPSLQVQTAGEEVMFVLQVTNVSDEAVEVRFPTGQSFDFRVMSGEREVWRWSADQTFTQALRDERLPAGESWRFEATWRPAAGEAGEFVASGELTASENRVTQSIRITIP